MSEEALKQEENIEEEGQIIDLDESVDKTEEATAEAPVAEVVEEKVEVEEKTEDKEDELVDYSDKVQKRINNLTRKLREAERGQDSAYQYAKNLSEENQRLKTTAHTLQQNTFDESATRLESQKAQAMASLQKAHEVADYEKVAQAQDVLAKIAVQEQRVSDGKQRMEQMQNTMQTPLIEPTQQQTGYNSKMQDWIDDGNDWFLNNALMHQSGTQIHEDLVTEGFVVESDAYFKEVDARIRSKHPEYFTNTEVKSKPSQKVASAGRVSGKTGNRQVKLSPSEVQMAKKLNVPLKEYAKYVKR
jgi:small-conductance mechanosensitive channel